MTNPPTIQSLEDLPFVTRMSSEHDNPGLCFWSPPCTGDYHSDYCLGEHYAALLCQYMCDSRNVEYFIQCFLDMQKYSSSLTQAVELGFLRYLAYEIMLRG